MDTQALHRADGACIRLSGSRTQHAHEHRDQACYLQTSPPIAFAACRSLGCSGAVLEVSARNEQAAALYTRMGFQSVGRRKRYYDDGSDAVIMSSTLA